MNATELLNSAAFLSGIGGLIYLQYRLTRLETQVEMIINILRDNRSYQERK